MTARLLAAPASFLEKPISSPEERAYDVQKLRITFPEKKSGIPAFFFSTNFCVALLDIWCYIFFQK